MSSRSLNALTNVCKETARRIIVLSNEICINMNDVAVINCYINDTEDFRFNLCICLLVKEDNNATHIFVLPIYIVIFGDCSIMNGIQILTP